MAAMSGVVPYVADIIGPLDNVQVGHDRACPQPYYTSEAQNGVG